MSNDSPASAMATPMAQAQPMIPRIPRITTGQPLTLWARFSVTCGVVVCMGAGVGVGAARVALIGVLLRTINLISDYAEGRGVGKG